MRVTLYIHCACVKLRPPLMFFLIYSPPLLVQRSGEEHMVETQKVHANSSNEEEEERAEPETSRSRRRRFKASNIAFVEMVDILKRADYEGKKAKIIAKVVKSLHRNFGVRQSKDQLRKGWSDLKIREHDQYRRIRRVLQKSK
ncbi:hypothetical protein AB205_0203160 [Aquarana catesbeiana]|uniref:Uncharacterized protein n=1 Tax=Aquarana catesbeiana TaxID=8400 RepID=A0A2G9QDY6_AQUCT|nr:hypothetical protein AB205_0203160 [Aquarana catesbeiana]